jgi:hypothetical protein
MVYVITTAMEGILRATRCQKESAPPAGGASHFGWQIRLAAACVLCSVHSTVGSGARFACDSRVEAHHGYALP